MSSHATSVLNLLVRSPSGVLVDLNVATVRAEALDGWVGVLPGREDLVTALQPGVIIARVAAETGSIADADAMRYFVTGPGLLEVSAGRRVVVLCRHAFEVEQLDDVQAAVDNEKALASHRGELQRGLLDDLAREALHRMVQQERA